MRGQDEQQLGVFSYVNPEQRIPLDHPLARSPCHLLLHLSGISLQKSDIVYYRLQRSAIQFERERLLCGDLRFLDSVQVQVGICQICIAGNIRP